MQIDFHGLAFDTPRVTCYLWSPWRASSLEHRLFEAIRGLTQATVDKAVDHWRLSIEDAKGFRGAIHAVARVLKGWQEEADPAGERRTWRWLFEGDTNDDGYDHAGDPISLWAFIRVGLDRGSPDEPDKGEDIDMEGFSLRIWGAKT